MPSALLFEHTMEQDKQQAPKRHACHCGKSFLRKEHLRRHQASHGEPAFACSVCNRSFTRSDLLRRHAALHDASAVPEFRRGRACDACHSNKTKCDGGAQCTLCSKRGLSCTYNRGSPDVSSSSRQGRPVSLPPTSSSGSAAGELSDGGLGGPLEAVSPAGSVNPLQELQIGHDVRLQDTIALAQRNASIQTTMAGLQIVLKQVMTHRSGQASSTPRPTSTPEVGAWLNTCIGTCFGPFHDRWPLLHGPTFEPTGQPVVLIATMAIVGSWLKDDKSTRNLAVEIHNNLVQQLLEDILRLDLDVKAQWPFETYVAALLNIIFAIETGRDYLLPKARLLQSLLQTALRGQGILNPDALAHQVNTYYPGDFVPWMHTQNERWKRLISIAFKVDSYMSLLTNDAPTLRLEELSIGIISTTAMWNSYGLDVFFRRWPCEPHDRLPYKIRDLSHGTFRNFTPSVVLVEDVQYSLLSMLPDIWAYSQGRQGYGGVAPNQTALKKMVCDHLQLCQDHINRIVGLLAHTGIQTQPGEALLGAYSCKEEPGHRSWKDNVKARIYSHIMTTTMLYHLLSMYVFADLPNLKLRFSRAMELGTTGLGMAPLEPKDAAIDTWANSTDGRIAVAHAICCLSVYERAVSAEEARGGTVDPILHSTLLSSAAVVWAWMTNCKEPCRCAPSMQQADLAMEEFYIQRSLELENWVVNWTPLSLSSMPLCRCSTSCWMERFINALNVGTKTWETNATAVMGNATF